MLGKHGAVVFTRDGSPVTGTTTLAGRPNGDAQITAYKLKKLVEREGIEPSTPAL